MKSPSECYVVHFISETRILYHVSETKVNAHIENIFSYRASPGQTSAESGLVHSKGNVRHLSGFTELMRQHAPHIRHLNSLSSISLRPVRPLRLNLIGNILRRFVQRGSWGAPFGRLWRIILAPLRELNNFLFHWQFVYGNRQHNANAYRPRHELFEPDLSVNDH